MNRRISEFFRNHIVRIDAGGLYFLVRDIFFLLIAPFLLLIVLFIRLLRPLILIRFGELISSRIGHLAGNTEIYLSERDAGIFGKKSLDFFYTNSFVCNRQLMKMWKRSLRILSLAAGLDWVNRALPGGTSHRTQWRPNQDRDIYGVLESTKAHISFTSEEERVGQEFLKNLGIGSGSSFVCFLSRDSAYLDAVLPRLNCHYHDYRDSDIKNFIPAVEELTERGYFALRMGAIVKEPLKVSNPKVIDYATNHRTDFLDIYLGAKCSFYLGDSCGFSAIPMVFRRPLAVVNMVPLEYAPTWCSNYLFIPKKLWLRKEGRFLSFQEILGSNIGRFLHSGQYEELGIEVIENTADEITALVIEMDRRLKGEWQPAKGDEELQKRFWALFKPSELNMVFRSRIGAEFLRQNEELLTVR